ncbi:hypothetical protein Tola_1925 [Tolumonas auensis DSM 9187]|uniref:Uncharacterized protein n=1 Tax=Tolumonas auensis (strain DSM 9187 / NBRC 110442 / TA 4) TaxID=595494 RepID=C4LG09_TOLAT|nr:hypothetical protein [Tolumonas auensis]ACQ93526.1 hypothetical protein Tola_1925 [Tolumonas auensis DSM 9187]
MPKMTEMEFNSVKNNFISEFAFEQALKTFADDVNKSIADTLAIKEFRPIALDFERRMRESNQEPYVYCRNLINDLSGYTQKGFKKLMKAGRKDLTVEFLVSDPRHQSLFSDAAGINVVKAANERITNPAYWA